MLICSIWNIVISVCDLWCLFSINIVHVHNSRSGSVYDMKKIGKIVLQYICHNAVNDDV